MKKVRIVLYTLSFILIVINLNIWFDKQEEKRLENALKYEECVMREYGVMPYHYYEEHGVYPTCEN